jgi:hypothetical protein
MRHLIFATFLLIFSLASCGDEVEPFGHDLPGTQDTINGLPPLASIACVGDDDCPVGSGCSSAGGVCVAFPPWTQSFSIQVDPDPAGSLLPDQFLNLAIEPAGKLVMKLASPVTVTGRVFHASSGSFWTGAGVPPGSPESDADYVAGRLVAVANGRVPGTQFRSETVVSAFDSTLPDQPMFTLLLLPNLSYQATFIPGTSNAGDVLPPFVFPLQVAENGLFDVVLPSRDAFIRVLGVVVANGQGGSPAGINGAQVSGKVGSDLIGTSSMTDDSGVFGLVLPPGDGPVEITVSPGRDSIGFPTRKFNWEGGIESLKADFASQAALSFDIGTIPVSRSVSVQVLAGDGSDTAVPSARLTAQGSAGDGDVTALATTDASGIARFELLEGQYALAVIPPTDSQWAMAETSLDLTTHAGQAFLVRLFPRVGIAGTVIRAATGVPVGGSIVSFMTGRGGALSAASQAISTEAVFQATTAEDGTFNVQLDPATYALMVQPPAGTGLPRVVYPTLELKSQRTIDVSLPEGALVRGSLFDTAGNPLVQTSVRFFFPVSPDAAESTWSLADTSFATTLQTAAECTTRDDGSFDTVLPVVSKDFDWNQPADDKNHKGMADFGLPAPGMK